MPDGARPKGADVGVGGTAAAAAPMAGPIPGRGAGMPRPVWAVLGEVEETEPRLPERGGRG